MDHNYDLLKSNEHKKTEEFLDPLINRDLFPTITHPTRITNSSATLIDNIFVSTNLHKNFDSAILINDMSDHMPVLTLLRQTKLKNSRPLIFESRNMTEKKIKLIKDKLIRTDWITLLKDHSCNESYNLFTNILKKYNG